MRPFSPILAALSAAALLLLPGCSHVGRSAPAKMTGVRTSTRAWISEGSLAQFADTEKLAHSRKGLHPDLEGWVDDHVAVRYGAVAPNDAGYEGEAAWTVEFAEPIAKLAATGKLDGSTRVRLRGTINGRELRMFWKPGRADMAPFGLGNNVLSDGGTPWMPLAAFDTTGDRYQIQVHLRSRTGKEFTHYSNWRDITTGAKQPPSDAVLAAARGFAALVDKCHPEWRDVRLLNLGAQGRHSAFEQEWARRNKAIVGTLGHPFEGLESAVQGSLPPGRIRTRMGRQISAYDAALFGRIELELLESGNTISRATLNLVSTFTAE
jgi:hypothetical protein